MIEAPSSEPTTGGEATVPERPGGASPVEGSHIGRYLVLGVLGHGGMGVVLSALDPQLDRRVALKLLHAGTPSDAQARLQREARALARLAHPNVIRVHDVGTHEGRVFIAMELVRGQTLADWMKEARPDWREVLRVFGLAGEGLVAAHAAGLVHRDFKPSNVLMGDDGQVKVTDFGLARTRAEVEPPSAEIPTEDLVALGVAGLDSAGLEATLTRTGALVGTPAYMAPEQLDGRPADHRADQFAFCVALYEALAGRRPFAGATPWQIATSIQAQRLAKPLPHHLPRALRAAVLRGLRVDPVRRHPDLASLLHVLGRSRSARRRQAAWLVAAAMVGGGAWWVGQVDARPSADYCAHVDEHLAGAWDDERRERAERAFAAIGRTYADDAWTRVRERMDAQAAAWVQAQRAACEAKAAEPPEASDDGLAQRMICLHRRLAELRGLGELLADADAELVERAPAMLDTLGSIDACDQARPPVADDDATAMAHVEALARITVLSEAGRYDDAVAAADEAVARAQGGSRAMRAEATLARARAFEEAGRKDDAERGFHEAFADAVASDHHEVALRASLGLAVLGSQATTPRFDEAERWTEHAEAARERMELPGTEFPGRIENIRAQIDMRRGDYEAALAHSQRALRLRQQDLGPDHFLLANYHNNLGQILADLMRQEEALVHLRRSLELERSRYGEEHPRVARAMSALGATLSEAGRLDEAIEIGAEAVAILRRSVGERHPALGTALINLGTAHARAGHVAEAERAFLDALANVEAVDGPGHRRVGLVLNNLGVHYEMTGQLAEAERYHRRAVEVFTEALGPAHPTTAVVISNLASVLIKEDELPAAETLLRETLVTLEERLGPEHPDVALPLGLLAQVLMDRGRHQEALPMLERVLALRQPGAAPPAEIADTCRALGEALWITGADRERAVELMKRARALYVDIGEGQRDDLELTEAWLREHGEAP
ncbi:MAG: serine/threonine protein kinase [Myxococcales bacterium]|nr:serine/threonine protein kinase [Myxococcales bacterium]MCB9717261.1 serine/threonine protein kinase [Myxococcales bacterium]